MRPLEPERRVGRAAANYDRHMVAALAIVSPLILAGVLTASAVAKLRTPDDLAGWAELGVPAALRREWLRRLHPWAEIALGAAIALVGGVIGLVSGLIAVALMIAYTSLVVGARRNGVAATCACFGRRRAVTRVTIARNLWLTLLAIATAATSWTTPLVGGPAAAGIADPGSLLALVLASATTALILWPEVSARIRRQRPSGRRRSGLRPPPHAFRPGDTRRRAHRESSVSGLSAAAADSVRFAHMRLLPTRGRQGP